MMDSKHGLRTTIFTASALLGSVACATPPAVNCPTSPENDDKGSVAVTDESIDDVAEGEEAESASTLSIELIVCHPESVHGYAEDTSAGGEASFACSLYDRDGVSKLLDADVPGTEYGSLTEALNREDAEGTVEYIYVYDQSTLEWLSDADRDALAEVFRAGAPIGLGGTDEGALTSALGLPEGHAGVLPEARTAHFVHLDGNAVEHLAVELAYQASFGEVLSEVMDWEEDNQRGEIEGSDGGKSARAQLDTGPGSYAGAGYGAALSGATSNVLGLPLASLDASIESGWNYCKSYSYSGKINDGDSDKGGYNMAFKFYYVTKEEVEDDYDRWLVISELTSSMSDYYTEDGNKHKGWYMRKMDLKATIGQYTGDIDEWSPSTTVGSSSRTSTIGAGISSSGPDASYSVATTNSTEDVSIKVDGNVSNNDGVGGQDWVEWGVEFSRCGTNNSDTKLKDPAAAAQGIWKEELALYTINDDNNEGVKVVLVPYFRVEHCRCGSSSCPIRKSTTYYPFGTNGSTFQVFEDTCN